MTIKGILLTGAALCSLSLAPALAASAPHVHVTALHAGAVKKSAMKQAAPGAVTYTFSVSTSVSTASAYKNKTKLAGTFYKFNSNSSLCTQPKEKVKLMTKKTKYAKLSTGTETYSEGCSSGPTTFYGDIYDLQTKSAAGKTDTFASTLTAHFKNSSGKEKGKLTLDVNVAIGK